MARSTPPFSNSLASLRLNWLLDTTMFIVYTSGTFRSPRSSRVRSRKRNIRSWFAHISADTVSRLLYLTSVHGSSSESSKDHRFRWGRNSRTIEDSRFSVKIRRGGNGPNDGIQGSFRGQRSTDPQSKRSRINLHFLPLSSVIFRYYPTIQRKPLSSNTTR